MKIKPAFRTGGVLVELGPRESQLPAQNPSRAAMPAFKLKEILVPVDFSECSKKALQYAIPFARQFNAHLTLIHVVQPCPAVPEMAFVDVETMEDGHRELKRLGQTIGDAACSATVLRQGVPHAEILEAARELGSDLIILATHGHTGLARVLLGSTAEKVVRHAPCPVLVVREEEREFVPPLRGC